MKALLLRQRVPKDVRRVTFNSLEEIDDMWAWLFLEISNLMGITQSEIWLWGSGPRIINYGNGLVEKWFKKFPLDKKNFDLIFSRGGFSQYIPIMKNNEKAKKIYYGAIYKDRFNPKMNNDPVDYDLVLADNRKQFDQLSNDGYKVHKFMKPACENIFKPVVCNEKTFDVVFIANAKQKAIKGHEWFFEKIKGTNLKILQIGNLDKELVRKAMDMKLKILFTGWIPRSMIPMFAQKAKVGVVCSTADSCPRVIPEMLAMNIPVVVRKAKNLFIWDDFFEGGNCILTKESLFVDCLFDRIRSFDQFSPRKFYLKHCSIKIVAREIVSNLLSI